jgi:hypothetical protein
MRKALILGCGLTVCGMSATALADVMGCTVLLCLASPTGWASIPECVSPVSSFLNAIKKKKASSTPNCPEQYSGVTTSVVQGERVYTLTSPDGTIQKIAIPLDAPAQ